MFWTMAFSAYCDLLQSDNDDASFPQGLRDRFAQLPVHEACYNASIATVDQLNSSNLQEHLADAYGMTPFHVTATSAKLRSDFMKLLLDRYPLEILSYKDRQRNTMMDYLLMHNSTKAIPLIKVVLHHLLSVWTAGWVSDSQRHDLSLRVDYICGEGSSNTRRDSVDETSKYFTSYVHVEITSIAEIALWKMKIVQMEEEEPTGNADRTFCRYKCGADVVLQNLTKFAWDDKSASSFAGLLLISPSD